MDAPSIDQLRVSLEILNRMSEPNDPDMAVIVRYEFAPAEWADPKVRFPAVEWTSPTDWILSTLTVEEDGTDHSTYSLIESDGTVRDTYESN
jgi:hypothetical protein